DQIPEDIRQGKPWTAKTHGDVALQGISKITDAEKELIQKALHETRGNKSTAAEKLGISRRTLYRKLEEYGLA
ncbi:MAG: helix-turn-helix domain-containing protein, partial [Candidatus Omnitrophica bacterium]|nr:helix-turn-helix domain-containing protein [Candidatus Omnitrophota bacterium]